MKISFIIISGWLFLSGATCLAAGVSRLNLPNEFEVTIIELPFEAGKFDIEGCSPKSKICLINGKKAFGVNRDIPESYVERITVEYRGRKHDLDVSDMYNAWGDQHPEGHLSGVCGKRPGMYCFLSGIFSRGESTFIARWVINDGVVERLILSDTPDLIRLFREKDEAQIFSLQNGIEVVAVQRPFEEGNFHVEDCPHESGVICFINGALPFGTDGFLPRRYIKRLSIYYRGVRHDLDVSNMYSAWGEFPSQLGDAFNGKCIGPPDWSLGYDYCIFRGKFSDACCGYAAEWIVKGGVVFRSVLTDARDIGSFFFDHMEPPFTTDYN